jgi:hypothetical protein
MNDHINPSRPRTGNRRGWLSRMVGLRVLAMYCFGQGAAALAMHALGLVSWETTTAALWFPWVTFAGAWIYSEKRPAVSYEQWRAKVLRAPLP